jgi:hypothetical protein
VLAACAAAFGTITAGNRSSAASSNVLMRIAPVETAAALAPKEAHVTPASDLK